MHTSHQATQFRPVTRAVCGVCAAAILTVVPLSFFGCDKDVSTRKTTTTKTTETPEGTKTTKETTEKKVETEHKNP